MSDVSILNLGALAAASLQSDDALPIVDVHDATQSPSGSTKKILVSSLFTNPTFVTSATVTGGTVTTNTPLVSATQTWNAGGVTFTALKLNVTNTASAAASLLLDLQVASSSVFKVDKTGAVTQAASLTVSTGGLTVTSGTTSVQAITCTDAAVSGTVNNRIQAIVQNNSTGTSGDATLLLQNTAGTFQLGIPSTGFSTSGTRVADTAYMQFDRAGGINIAALNAAGAIRFYTGGTSLALTLASSLAATFAADVTAVSFSTVVGITASTATGVAVTLFTASSLGVYLVSAFINSAGVANYMATAIVAFEGTGARIMQQTNGAALTITLSGNAVQATQNSGAPSTINYRYTKF